ncbi:hypothetical protein [uncultured Marinobacter sp.]|nr:hypothetical protein [uncultured Marinobacter sp.]
MIIAEALAAAELLVAMMRMLQRDNGICVGTEAKDEYGIAILDF